MRAVIHVGPHKTGTTSFQVACRRAYQVLLNEGVLYPLVGPSDEFSISHAVVADAIRAGREEDVLLYFEKCKAEASRCGADTVLLSSEEFSSLVWKVGALAQFDVILSRVFEQHEFVIVLRRIRDSFSSQLRQLVTHFNADLFDQVNLDRKLEAVVLVLDRLLKEASLRTRTVRFEDLRSGNLAWNLLRFCIEDDLRASRIELEDVKANSSDQVAKDLFGLITPLFRALIVINNDAANPYSSVVEDELGRLFRRQKAQEFLQENISGDEISNLVSRGLRKVSEAVIDRNREYLADKYPNFVKLGLLE
jgi:hypothetical protein